MAIYPTEVQQSSEPAGPVSSSPTSMKSSSLKSEPMRLPTARHDRLVQFMMTLVTYPYVNILASKLSTHHTTVTDFSRNKLKDFPEGRAIVNLERWCREAAYGGLIEELVQKYAQLLRALILHHVRHQRVRSLLLHPRLVRAARVPPDETLEQILDSQLRVANLHNVLRPLQVAIGPNMTHLRDVLEQKFSYNRGRTTLEYSDIVSGVVRMIASSMFTFLRSLARALRYLSSILSIVSGAVSFTVILAILLSVISAVLQFFSVSLEAICDVGQPTVMRILSWTDKGKEMAKSQLAASFAVNLVGPRTLPSLTVEEQEDMFLRQLQGDSHLVNRPEIPLLSKDPLLVTCYDANLIDQQGDIQSEVVYRLMNIKIGPYKPGGFFRYAPKRHYKASLVNLARLLCWKRINMVIAGREALRYLAIAGGQSKVEGRLFSRLVGQNVDQEMTEGADLVVDVRAVAGERNIYAMVYPSILSEDSRVAKDSLDFAKGTISVLSCLVFVVDANAPPEDQDMTLLVQAMRAKRSCLVCLERPPDSINEAADAYEKAKSRWQSTIFHRASEHGADGSYSTVMVTDLQSKDVQQLTQQGYQGYQQVREWVVRVCQEYQRAV